VYSRVDAEPETLRIRLGTLDQDPGGRAVVHLWTASKAPWFVIADDLPQLPEVPSTA
jgi:hypothetical protein